MVAEEIHYVGATIPASAELVAEYASTADAVRDAIEHPERIPGPQPAQPVPEGHTALMDATDGALRAVVGLHQPVWSGYSWHCEGCDLGPYPEDTPEWPCSTVELIGLVLGVEVDGG